jgi:hypothetical protein
MGEKPCTAVTTRLTKHVVRPTWALRIVAVLTAIVAGATVWLAYRGTAEDRARSADRAAGAEWAARTENKAAAPITPVRTGAPDMVDPNWAVAVATIVLALVAAFQSAIERRIYHPTLELTTETRPPDCVRVTVTDTFGAFITYTIFLRVKITNTGNTAAEKVEVYAESLFRHVAKDRWERVTSFPSMSLVWANTQREVFYPLISPSMAKYCDVAHIHDPRTVDHPQLAGDRPTFALDDPPKPTLAFDVQTLPNHRSHVVKLPGTYRLNVIVAAQNSASEKWEIDIHADGEWRNVEEQMLGKHVTIAVRRAPLEGVMNPEVRTS